MSFTIKRGPIAADNFTIISNALLRDHRLSLKARGLAGWLLTHRGDFELTQPRIAELNGCGPDAVRTAVDELEKLGYLRRERARDEKTGQLGGAVYHLTDSPVSPGEDQDGISLRRPSQPRENPAHKKTTSQEDHSEVPAAVAPELPLDLPRPEPESRDEVKPPTLNQRANALAANHYERLGKMGNVPAFLKIIRKALEHGYADDAVDKACAWIAQHNWTLTEERLANTLRGGPQRPNGAPAVDTRPVVRTGPGGRSGPILENW